MGMLWNYTMEGKLTNKNAGFSMWGFATKNGEEYFVKQFLSPKYPENDTESSVDRIARKVKLCKEFEEQKKKIYDVVNSFSDGNDVRIQEFFRVESKYYISMERIRSLPLTIEDIAAFNEPQKRALCANIAHSIAALHKGHLVHSDLKHENILFVQTREGAITAKVIDFDSAFLESDPPREGEEVVGDWGYFSPEVLRHFDGENVKLNCKLDVFALGVLFHRYFSGELPGYPVEEYISVGQAVQHGAKICVSECIPSDVRILLEKMLTADPEDRPSANEVFCRLRGENPAEKNLSEESSKPNESSLPEEDPIPEQNFNTDYFVIPGNLETRPTVKEEKIRFCQNCSGRLKPSARFCTRCGSRVR